METIPVRHIKKTLSEPEFSGSFEILDLEIYLAGMDMIQELHRHSFFYILVLEKGSGKHSIDFVSYSVRDNSIFFMRPGQVHELTLKNGSSGYLIKFSSDFFSPLEMSASHILKKVSNNNFYPLTATRMINILFILKNIYTENADRQDRYKEAIRSYLDIFFIELLRQSRNPKEIANDSTDHMQERLAALQELITINVSGEKQVSYYAAKLHLSSYQLNAITKATLGKTCSELINEYIVLEAKRYLLATSSQINQIAWHLGYEDVSYFVRFFKKHTGYTPEAFRKNYK